MTPSRDIIKECRKKATNWKNILETNISDTELVSRLYKELLQIGNEKISVPIFKKREKNFKETLHRRGNISDN